MDAGLVVCADGMRVVEQRAVAKRRDERVLLARVDPRERRHAFVHEGGQRADPFVRLLHASLQRERTLVVSLIT